MKKIISFILCTLLLISAVYPAVSAVSVESDIERFDDGSYLTVTYVSPPSDSTDEDYWENIDDAIEEDSPSVLTKLIRWLRDFFKKLFAKQETVTKSKYCNYFDSNGKCLWSVRLSGTFSYNHRKAVCVSSEITYEIKDSDWKMLSYTSNEDGNTATGEFSIRQYKLGVPLKLIEKTLTLICDKEGNVTSQKLHLNKSGGVNFNIASPARRYFC